MGRTRVEVLEEKEKGESEEEYTRRSLVLILHYWHSFVGLRFSHSAGRQAGTRVS